MFKILFHESFNCAILSVLWVGWFGSSSINNSSHIDL